MKMQTLDSYLRKCTEQELEHRRGIGYNYSKYPVVGHINEQPIFRFDEDLDREAAMIENNISSSYANLALLKQNRFETVPLHIHNWIELNYMYSGNCTFTINGETIELTEGQMCLIDTNAVHSVSRCGENDILMNFLINKNYLNTSFFDRLAENNYLTTFFIETLSNRTAHDNYIFFHSEENENIPTLVKMFMCEYYDTSIGSEHIIDSLMTLILCELINIFEHDLTYKNQTVDNAVIPMIRYIERNYNNCTLESMAEFFNMHPNYLSSYIKKHTGKSYKELIQTQRLQQAAELLKNTKLSANDICIHVGYQNNSFFFRKFKEHFGCSPKEYRENLKS